MLGLVDLLNRHAAQVLEEADLGLQSLQTRLAGLVNQRSELLLLLLERGNERGRCWSRTSGPHDFTTGRSS